MKRFSLAASLITLLVFTGCVAPPSSSSRSNNTTTVQKETSPSAPAASSNRDGKYNWSSLAFPTGNDRTSAVKLEKGMPKEVRLNQGFTYEIVVTNLTDMTLEAVKVNDVFDGNTTYTSSSPKGTATKGAVAWDLGALGPRESQTITVQAKAAKEGHVGSCATVSYNSKLCASSPVVQPMLKLVKTGTANTIKCDPITYDFVVSNPGSGAITGVTITDQLPDGVVAADGSKSINFNVGTLKAGESKKFTAKANATRTGKFVNSAKASADGGVTAESGKVTTTVTQPVLAITKTGTKKMYAGGSRTINYTIKVTNTGDGVARDTKVVDLLPAGTRFVSASDGGRSASGRVTWDLGVMAPKASRTLTLKVAPASIGKYTNTATASAYCASDVSASHTTDVDGIPAILLEVVDLEDPIEVGSTVTYQIRVTNQGTAAGRDIKINAIVPSQMEYVSSGGPTNGSSTGANVTFAPLGNLGAGKTATYTITVRTKAAADVRFKVSMTSAQSNVPVEETESTYIYE
ncbi:MAG: DUF7507 domain-containing protein [Planctomycetota bacterium]